jgi:hypothetical protein
MQQEKVETNSAGVDEEFKADLPQVPDSQLDTPATEAQAEIEGKTFNRDISGEHDAQKIMQKRVVRIVTGQEGRTGTTVFRTLDQLPEGMHPSDLPHITPKEATEHYDLANEGSPMEKTARKRRASSPFVNTEEDIRKRGGDSKLRVPKRKQGGWFTKKP